MRLELELEAEDVELLEVLAKSYVIGDTGGEGGTAAVESVVRHLIASAVDGVRRPGSWERGWLTPAFGDDWTELLEQDPAVKTHDRPRRGGR